MRSRSNKAARSDFEKPCFFKKNFAEPLRGHSASHASVSGNNPGVHRWPFVLDFFKMIQQILQYARRSNLTFGIIKIRKTLKHILTNQENKQQRLACLPYFGFNYFHRVQYFCQYQVVPRSGLTKFPEAFRFH